jgi:branched-chain amino acid transport system permease protein
MTWLNALIQGVLLGGLYALFACGLSLMFGVLRVVNLAHGDLSVLAAFGGLVLVEAIHLPPFWTLLVVVPLVGGVGYLLQRYLLTPALARGALAPLLVTFGLSIVIQNGLQELFSADTQSLNVGAFGTGSLAITADLAIGWFPLLAFVVGVGVIAALQLVLRRTQIGRVIRATSDDRDTVGLMGVDQRRVYAIATAIALSTVAIAGVFLAMRTTFTPSIGPTRLIFAFEAVIIGGLGSLWGTLAGGVILGVAQAIGAQVDPAYGVLTGHLVFLAMLAFRPQGLVPSAVTR